MALAGATGSGKSILFNALTGSAWPPGVRRPTTGSRSRALGADGAGELLDWLEIRTGTRLGRHGRGRAAGLVLLDLPDHDSTVAAHRAEVDRLLDLVDLFVWVLDPQKYADAALHERYLRPLAGHRDVMLVVLNQVDRLAPADARTPARPPPAAGRRRPAGVPVLPSGDPRGRAGAAAGGAGRRGQQPAGRPPPRRHAVTSTTPVAALGTAVRAGLPGSPPGRPPRSEDRLVAALVAAAGVRSGPRRRRRPFLPDAGDRRRRLAADPVAAPRLRPDPLRRLHLGTGRARRAITAGADDADLVPTSQRTSLPATGAVERSRVELALRRLGDDAAAGLPDPWPDALRDAARSRAGDLADSLDRAVAATDLGLSRKPLWWRAFGLLQVLLAATAIAGALWLAGLYALTVLRLPEPEPPQVGIVPLPTVLLIGGLLAGVVLALLARALAVLGARRRRARAEARLRAAVAQVADALVLDPVRAELAAYAALREAVATLHR